MVIVVMYACAVKCGRSFTVSSVWGVLAASFVGGNWLTHYVYLYPCS